MAHELGLGQDVPFHGDLQVVIAQPGGQVETRVQGVESEIVAVGAGGRAWATVIGFAEIVDPGCAGGFSFLSTAGIDANPVFCIPDNVPLHSRDRYHG